MTVWKNTSTSNHSIENQESNFVVGNRDISVLVRNGEIHLDEFESHVAEDQAFGEWAERISILLFKDELSRKMFRERLVLISDEAFQYFVTMCCEITTRIRISEKTKTVEDGAFGRRNICQQSLFCTALCGAIKFILLAVR